MDHHSPLPGEVPMEPQREASTLSNRPKSSLSIIGSDRPTSSQSRPQSSQSTLAERIKSSKSRRSVEGTSGDGDEGAGGIKEEELQVVSQPQEPGPKGWSRFQTGVRGLWSTRMMDDTSEDKDLHAKITLRELITYLFFLLLLTIVAHGMTSKNMFYFTDMMEKLFLDTPFTDKTNNFRDTTNLPEFWKFSKVVMLDGLYPESHYNSQNMSQGALGYIMDENKVLGRARLRQLKVRNDSCEIQEDFKNQLFECFTTYAKQFEEKRPFGPMNGTAWEYQSEAELDAGNHWGEVASYGGGGYVINLGETRAESEIILQHLFDNLWLDRSTRAVFIDFTVYNANLNLFCSVRLVSEYPATGGTIPSWYFRTLKLIRYVSPFDYCILVCEILYFLFIIYYLIEEALEMKKHGLRYFTSLFNLLDIVIIIVSLICAAFNVYRTISVSAKLEELIKKDDIFMDFEFLSYWQQAYNYAVAWMVFFAWMKLFKYVSFNKTMSQLSTTLVRCAADIAGFAVMFFIVFFAYGQLGYLIFGSQIRDFRSFIDACFTLFRIVLGDFDFNELDQANRVLGPIFFITYVFFVFFVLINMFLAIINDTYSEVKAELATQENDSAMGDYFKRLVGKLRKKRDKIASLQEALKTADADGDNEVDFEEWRTNLKKQGYTEAEIERVFERYDTDGDRVLGAEEQALMRKDLEQARQDVDMEFREIGDRAESRAESRAKSRGQWSFTSRAKDDTTSTAGDGKTDTTACVPREDFTLLRKRVDRIESSLDTVKRKVDELLLKLEAKEKLKLGRLNTMALLLESISEAKEEGAPREEMDRIVDKELEKLEDSDQDSSDGSSPLPNAPQPISRAPSAALERQRTNL